MDYFDEIQQAFEAMLLGVIYSFVHPLIVLATISPLPWNATLVALDVTIWLLKLSAYQTFYAFEFVLWWADFWYQMSVRMITKYDETSAFLYYGWFDHLWLIVFSPIYALAVLFDYLWEDIFSSRPDVVDYIEWTHLCNIDYWEENSPYYMTGKKCFSEDLLSPGY